MLLHEKKQFWWFPTRSDTDRAVQPKKVARCLEFLIEELEGLYYLCGEKRGVDQLRSGRAADLRLCFRICRFFMTRLVCTWTFEAFGLTGSD